MKQARTLVGLVVCAFLTACGGGGTGPTAPAPVVPPTPSASISATGNGALVLHPSLNPTFTFSIETPLRIMETAGGSADWNFARLQFFKGGVETERAEVGSDVIQAAGVGRIAARGDIARTVLFRFNSDDFDTLAITLGFNDVKDGRAFTVMVAGNTFTDVTVSLTPLALIRSKQPL